MREPIAIILVYGPEGRFWRDGRWLLEELETRLRPLEREGLIWFELDRFHGWAEEDWEWRFYRASHRAKFVLLLLPIDFHLMHFHYGFELERTIERIERHGRAEVQVIPFVFPWTSKREWEEIYLREIERFSRLRALLKDPKPIEIENWYDEEKALDSVVDRCPMPSLSSGLCK